MKVSGIFFFLHVCMLQHAWSAATQFAMQDLGGRAMSVKTSKTLIGELLGADLGNRHFSVWTLKEQHEAIRRCGLASSQCKSRKEATAMLRHLHTTDLPTDHLAVLHLIAELGLPPSGARSKQQFSFYLLDASLVFWILSTWQRGYVFVLPPRTSVWHPDGAG